MSLDGMIAGINDTPEQALGENGSHLHDWITAGEYPSRHSEYFKLSEKNREVFDGLYDSSGAIITGRRTYDIVHGWQGSYPVEGIPVFVLTHNPPGKIPDGKTTFTFVTEGIHSVVKQAKAAAGNRNVKVIGGAQTIQQCINQGLCNELRIHLVSQLLKQGIRLFENIQPGKIRFEYHRMIANKEVVHHHLKLYPK